MAWIKSSPTFQLGPQKSQKLVTLNITSLNMRTNKGIISGPHVDYNTINLDNYDTTRIHLRLY